uniref:ATP-binding protein n=1 Tax=Paenarthrobacter nicotinovorans TaxID=29320 RepID=UPI0022B227AC|nr:ATP-binding protein [Paenarthrobacter nicotinovorans]
MPRWCPLPRDCRTRSLRSRPADQGREIPRAQANGGVQFRPPACRGPEPRRASRHRGSSWRKPRTWSCSVPGTGKTHLAVGIGIRAARAGHRVLFDTATGWVSRLAEAHDRGRLPQELAKLRRFKLLIVDEVGYFPFDQDSANLFFQLVSSRYEHASLVLTNNLAFSRWGEVFSDATVAPAMIDRIVHHAEVLNLTGSSYRLRNKTRTQLQAQ